MALHLFTSDSLASTSSGGAGSNSSGGAASSPSGGIASTYSGVTSNPGGGLASTSRDPTPTLNLLSAYENGSVQLRRYTPPRNNERRRGPYRTIEGRGWQVTWSYKAHNETGKPSLYLHHGAKLTKTHSSVMGMSISLPNTLALTVSADHLIGRYDLAPTVRSPIPILLHLAIALTYEQPGSTYTFRFSPPYQAPWKLSDHDPRRRETVRGRELGWTVSHTHPPTTLSIPWTHVYVSRRVRLFSTRSLKALGTLSYHKESCQAVAFAHPLPPDPEADVGEEEEEFGLSVEEKSSRSRWLVAGGKDGRVSVWELKEFAR